ncbi:MTURN isoform 4, partial [Pongo abelii]
MIPWVEWNFLQVLEALMDKMPTSGVFLARPLESVAGQHVWSESEDCLPFLQLAQDYISSCGKKTLHEVLEKVFKSF